MDPSLSLSKFTYRKICTKTVRLLECELLNCQLSNDYIYIITFLIELPSTENYASIKSHNSFQQNSPSPNPARALRQMDSEVGFFFSTHDGKGLFYSTTPWLVVTPLCFDGVLKQTMFFLMRIAGKRKEEKITP